MNRFIATFIVLATLCASDALAQAAYLHRPVHIIVPFLPGGPADALARLAADKLAQSLGKPFIVDNKAGAGGNIGMEQGDIVHVPFNGVAPATNAVLAGDVQMSFAQSSAALPQWRAGKVVALGVATRKRLASEPELPTIAEQGLPDFEATSWYALVAPAGTPAPIIERLHGELVRAPALPDVREKIAALGAEPVGNSPLEFATMQRTEAVRWMRIVKEANIRAD